MNFNTKTIIGGPDVQSRGFIYLKDADYIVKEIAGIIEKTINDAVASNRYENMAVRMEAKDKITRYVIKDASFASRLSSFARSAGLVDAAA